MIVDIKRKGGGEGGRGGRGKKKLAVVLFHNKKIPFFFLLGNGWKENYTERYLKVLNKKGGGNETNKTKRKKKDDSRNVFCF